MTTCPDCRLEHDTEPCARESADCDCCRSIDRASAS